MVKKAKKGAAIAPKKEWTAEDKEAFDRETKKLHDAFIARLHNRYQGKNFPYGSLFTLERLLDSQEQWAGRGYSPSMSENDIKRHSGVTTRLRVTSREIYKVIERIPESEMAAAMLYHVDNLFMDALALGAFGPFPADMTLSELDKKRTQLARDARRGPKERRKTLLREGNFNCEEIAASRKLADAAALKIAEIFEANGLSKISGKQLQRYARDILTERRESPGHSDRAPRK